MPFLTTKRERATYSLARLISHSNLRGNPSNGSGLEADLARVCRQEIAGFNVGGPDGGFIPAEILNGDYCERALTAGTFTDGGALTSESERTPFLQWLFAQSCIFGLGANYLGGLSFRPAPGTGEVPIPAFTGAAEGQWLSESEGATDQSASLTVALKNAVPKRVVATIAVSNQLLRQTGPAAEAALWRVLTAGCAAAIDRAALAGSGGVKPTGILNMPGVTTVSLGTDGGALTRIKLNAVEGGPVDGNVPLRMGGYGLSPNTREKAKAIQTATGTSTFLVDTVAGQDYCNGYRSVATPLLPDNGTKGTGQNLGSLIFGADWSALNCIQWGGAMIVADPFKYALNNRTILTITLMLDIVSPHASAFGVCTDVVNS